MLSTIEKLIQILICKFEFKRPIRQLKSSLEDNIKMGIIIIRLRAGLLRA
jgi:hypothetical protein